MKSMDRLRAANPHRDLPAPPIERVLSRLNERPAWDQRSVGTTPRTRRARRAAGTLAVMFSVAVAVLVGVVAIVVAGSHGGQRRGESSNPGARALFAELAVLHRPQIPADRVPGGLGLDVATAEHGAIVPALTRELASLPQAQVFLVVYRPATATRTGGPLLWNPRLGDLAGLVIISPYGAGQDHYDTVTVTEPVPATALSDPLQVEISYPGGPQTSDGDSLALVPDRVAAARWVFTRPGAPRQVEAPTITDNLASSGAPRSFHLTSAAWYAANGRRIASRQQSALVKAVSSAVDPAVATQLAVFLRAPGSADTLPSALTAQLLSVDASVRPNVRESREVPTSNGQTAYLVPARRGLVPAAGQSPQPGVCAIDMNGSSCVSAGTLAGTASVDLCSPTLPLGHLQLQWLLPDGATNVAVGMSNGTTRAFVAGFNVYIATLPLNRSSPIPQTINWTDSAGEPHSKATPIALGAQDQRCAHPNGQSSPKPTSAARRRTIPSAHIVTTRTP
jgi:hypothetical protein